MAKSAMTMILAMMVRYLRRLPLRKLPLLLIYYKFITYNSRTNTEIPSWTNVHFHFHFHTMGSFHFPKSMDPTVERIDLWETLQNKHHGYIAHWLKHRINRTHRLSLAEFLPQKRNHSYWPMANLPITLPILEQINLPTSLVDTLHIPSGNLT